MTASPSQQVALTLAECLTDIALAGKRLLNLAQKEMVKDALQRNPGVDPSEISVESNYRENMKRAAQRGEDAADAGDEQQRRGDARRRRWEGSRPQIACAVIRHIDDYYQFFGHKYFLEEVANLFLQKINSNYNYVRFLFIDMFTLLYKLSNNSLEGCMRSFINTVYNHHHLVVIKVLSVFVALLSDKELFCRRRTRRRLSSPS